MNLRSFFVNTVLCLSALLSFGQTAVVPFMGVGSVQFFDNSGKPLTAGVVYFYQAGTSTQQATYSDSMGSTVNPNPVPLATGGRLTAWLAAGSFYKVALCSQNDGPFCAPSDVLFSVDQVPAGSTSTGGGGGSPFISGSVNPASSGILRLANGDTVCWRNAAGSANLCLTTDTSDVLTWPGGAFKISETACSNTGAGFDFLCADSSAHRFKMANNGGAQLQIAAAGQDINTSDFVTQLHFGSTPAPLASSLPGSNQMFCWSGTVFGACPLALPTATGAAILEQVIASGTAAMGTTEIGSPPTFPLCGDGATITVTSGSLTGITTSDRISWSYAAAPINSSAQTFLWPYTTANHVNFQWCSASPVTPAGVTVNWAVYRP